MSKLMVISPSGECKYMDLARVPVSGDLIRTPMNWTNKTWDDRPNVMKVKHVLLDNDMCYVFVEEVS